MSAGKSLHSYTEGVIALRHRLCRERIGGRSTHTAGTAHKDLSFIFRIEVNEIITLHEITLHPHSSGQARFFITGKDALNGTMLYLVRFQNSHLHGHTDTVVSTKGCTFGTEPFTVNVSLDGIIVEIKVHILVLFANHIHVALQDYRFPVFIARCSRFADTNVSRFVHHGRQPQSFAKGFQESNHLFFTLGRTGNPVNFSKAIKHNTRL